MRYKAFTKGAHPSSPLHMSEFWSPPLGIGQWGEHMANLSYPASNLTTKKKKKPLLLASIYIDESI